VAAARSMPRRVVAPAVIGLAVAIVILRLLLAG
jgi:hypothetical protein